METQNHLLNHLIELRQRLIYSVLAIVIVFLGTWYFSSDLYHYLALPLIKHLPHGSQLIATNITSPFITPLKFAFVLAIFICMPYIFYHAWRFIAPALYRHEKKFLWGLLVLSGMLFYLGIAFAYFVIFPLVFNFFTHIAPHDVTVMPDMREYLDFCLKLFFAFGLAFEVPVITLLLISTGMVSIDSLTRKRPYIIVGAFVIGMLLTPPDVLSQVLLAVPIWLLFEVGILLGRMKIASQRSGEVVK